MRTLVDIPDNLIEALNAMAKAKKVSRAELVREAISEYLKIHDEKSSHAGIERFFGLWGADFEDGLAYQQRLRAEWGRSVNVVFDTNILIDFLGRVPSAKTEMERYQPECKSISLMTWIEVMTGSNATNEAMTRSFLEGFVVLSITEAVAERSAVIRRQFRMKLPDAIIWATAGVHGRLLVTRNTRDFPANDPSVRIPYVL